MPTVATPTILTDPGYLFHAPAGTAIPSAGGTVAGSKFTDAWPVAWVPLGATEEGSTFSYESSVEAIRVAEFFDPIRYATTERTGSFAFNLADYTLHNLRRALNAAAGAVATVSGTGATLLSKFTPPVPGAEVRSMIGWESLDNTLRIICYQVLCSGAIEMAFAKAPSYAVIPMTWNLEVPTSTVPFEFYSAGAARVGTP